MDVLSDLLSTLHVRGTLYFTTELHRPFGIRVPAFRRVARFHLVARGGCWVRVDGHAHPLRLEAGDMLLVPNGAAHSLSDGPDSVCVTLDDVVAAAGFTGRGSLVWGEADGGAPTRLVCGHFEFDDSARHPLLAQLPSALPVRWADAVRGTPLEHVFRFIVHEASEARPGHASVVARLSEVVFVQVVRSWAARENHTHGVLAALADARLGAALAAMHETPEAPWTLERLGRVAALSRTAFAERFRTVVGETPLQYLTHWRMQRAMRLLAESQLGLQRIAERNGYDSAASFSRAFRKVTGRSPGAYRRAARAADAPS